MSSILRSVKDTYSGVARTHSDKAEAIRVATAFGYTQEELLAVPDESHMGLSCGNPVATANLREGEHVLDLGSGGGIDVFLAADKVGPTGQVVGLDMSDDMLARARRNASRTGRHPPQVAFASAIFGEQDLPIADESVDCILSNCVLNLVPTENKPAVLRELFRVLRPGGRLAVHDILTKGELSQDLRDNLGMVVGCISGAVTLEAFESMLQQAGFEDVVIVDSKSDLNVFLQSDEPAASSCCTSAAPADNVRFAKPSPDFNINEHAASCSIYALKPSTPTSSAKPDMLKRWWDAFPPTRATVPRTSAEHVATLVRSNASESIAVIDVRDDNELAASGRVAAASHRPSRAFYDDLDVFTKQFGSTAQVAFYCGSSSGRGPRCAGWYQDHLDAKGLTTSKAVVLEGGWKAWQKAYGQDAKLTTLSTQSA